MQEFLHKAMDKQSNFHITSKLKKLAVTELKILAKNVVGAIKISVNRGIKKNINWKN